MLGSFREFSSGYLFILDLFMILGLLLIIYGKDGSRPWLGVALIVYLVGHAVERFWIWSWWARLPAHSTVWDEIATVRQDPTLFISFILISVGLTWCVFVLANYWGKWLWAICVLLAILVPAALMYY